MRITFIIMYNGLSGGTRVASIYADRLARRGHDVTVLSTPGRKPSTKQQFRTLLKTGRWPKPRRAAQGHMDNVAATHRVLESFRPVTDADVPDGDAVVAFWWETAPWVANLSPSKGAKAYFMQDYGVAGQSLQQIVPTWKLPLHLMTISQFLVNLMREHVAKPIDLIPNAVDTDLFHTPPRGKQSRPTVGFTYAPYWSKGCDLCLAAIEEARRRVPDLQAVTFGRRTNPAFPLPEWVTFHRNAPDEQLASIYASCDAWLFGSRFEGFGLPILEAMACRTPVLATDAGAAPDLLAGGGGELIRPKDATVMADAIERAVRLDDAAWRELSNRAYATATGYTWEDATDRFEAALHRAGAPRAERGQPAREASASPEPAGASK